MVTKSDAGVRFRAITHAQSWLPSRSSIQVSDAMKRYDLAIFDFDGTLADSAAWFRSMINHVARRYDFRQITDAELEELRGRRSTEIVRYLGVPAWKMPFIAR